MPHTPENCKEVFAMLSQYLDLELPSDDCQAIEEHLAGCAPCMEFLESLKKTVKLCHECQPSTVPAPLTPEARRELEGAWKKMLERRGG